MSARVGFAILSHKSGDYLPRLIRALDREYDQPPIAVHHDTSRAPIDFDVFRSNVEFVRPSLKTSWASISVVQAALQAFALLHRGEGPDWTFLLSAQDYPIMSGARVRRELGDTDVDAFVDIWPTEPGTSAAAALVGDCSPGMAHFGLEGYRKMRWKLQFLQQFWVPLVRLNPSLRIGRHTWRLPIKARHPFDRDFRSFYGDLWFAANRKAVEELLNPGPKELALQSYSKRRFLPEEGYFAIALANRPGLRLCRDNRRFVKWAGGDHPKLLEESDVDEMLASGCFFARKFDERAPVLDLIDQRLRQVEMVE